MQIITDPAGKELKKHGDSSFPFLVSYERLSGYETGSFLWHWHPEIELTYIEKGEMLYKIVQVVKISLKNRHSSMENKESAPRMK